MATEDGAAAAAAQAVEDDTGAADAEPVAEAAADDAADVPEADAPAPAATSQDDEKDVTGDGDGDEPLAETAPGERAKWDVDQDDVKQASLEDSNMAGHGGKEHREFRKSVAANEKAWLGVGEELGLQIWRIEKFKVKHWPKERYGEFYGGDSYIILNTYKESEDGPKKYNAHFWLGAETTQDEAGTAAYKTVELDDVLGDEPVQYREVQGNESKMFADMFEKMTVLEGGIETGFNHVKPTEYQPRLLHVRSTKKGRKRKTQVNQVPLNCDSLNDDDTFILDAGLECYQWNGKTANVWEKRKGMMVLNEIVDSRHGKVKRKQAIDDLEKCEDFWKYFGGRPESIKEHPHVEPKSYDRVVTRVSDESGKLEFTEVRRGNIVLSDLDSADAFIVDVGLSVYVWVGKGCTKQEKRESMKYAIKLLEKSGRPLTIPICRVMEGKEPIHFLEQFKLSRSTIRSNPFAGIGSL